MISRRILVAVALLCLVSPAMAQKTKAQLDTEITTNFPDNTVGAITPSILRTTTQDMINSIMPTAPVVSGNLACYDGTTGLLKDCGSAPIPLPLSLANGGLGASQSAATANQVPVFPGSGGGAVPTSFASWQPGVDNNMISSKTANYTAVSADCGSLLSLGGNAQFTLTVNAASGYTTDCKIIVINADSYSGPGTGRGKLMAINGITNFWLYPGQRFNLRQSGTSWIADGGVGGPLNGSYGFLWEPPVALQLFVDNSGSDSANDGLASGSTGAFATRSHCATVAYSQIYTRNMGSIQCSLPPGQNISEFVQVFYPLNGGGTLIFNSTVPGTQTSWTCPVSSYCLQFGDGALVGITDINFITNTSTLAVFTGHNHGILDLNTNNSFGGNGIQPIFECDFDSHFNINNGFTYSTGWTTLFSGCQGSRWNINGAINSGGTQTVTNLFKFPFGTLAQFQGNVTWGTTGLTTAAGILSGNSVLNNAAAAPPGGAPTPVTGAQYCTATPC